MHVQELDRIRLAKMCGEDRNNDTFWQEFLSQSSEKIKVLHVTACRKLGRNSLPNRFAFETVSAERPKRTSGCRAFYTLNGHKVTEPGAVATGSARYERVRTRSLPLAVL